MLFKYIAVDSTNAQREGTVDAASVDAAIMAVQKRGYTVVSIDEINEKSSILNFEFHFFEVSRCVSGLHPRKPLFLPRAWARRQVSSHRLPEEA